MKIAERDAAKNQAVASEAYSLLRCDALQNVGGVDALCSSLGLTSLIASNGPLLLLDRRDRS